MHVFSSLDAYRPGGVDAVTTIGTFDGVHLGHQVILSRLKQLAKVLHGETVVITFNPHPRQVLYPEDNDLRLLTLLPEKLDLLEANGIDRVLVIPFDRVFSRISAEQFVKQVLVETVKAKYVTVGYDHRFGKNRTGGIQEITRLGLDYGFRVEEIPAHQIDNANVSSTKIRVALAAGEVKKAARLLGYPYKITGKVILGDKKGRLLGFPTANIELPDIHKLIPGRGVYAAEVTIMGNTTIYKAMCNIGYRPTLSGTDLRIEAHLFDFDQDIYGQSMTITFIERLRDERKFADLAELKAQLFSDKQHALAILEESQRINGFF